MPTPFRTSTGITVELTGQHALLRLPSEVDFANYDDLHTCAQRLLDDGVPAMIFDLTSCEYCDSSVVDAILRAHRRAGELNTPLTLRLPPSGIVRRVCAITGVTRIVPFEESEASVHQKSRIRLGSPESRFRR
ncbi:STAS domain-containing protein [Actinomadura madurae]|uniref:STAS domain-containing protein n=1 Tax=Actinomadura madurae TaxID=1993 RepID=UPI00202751D1|nr:STAS domain-containing protein [Actinomadura madurae]MCP9955400.1 STAS domain-containing protein [Actinomadura madurae]MCP9972135.1 STAS domain-containing protein [Actinomadura madurae]MCP9984639.1 STAS domain-containing protein [Actinomadura madurae]MCQ0003811.1 STAS domain-containing protein [Actinomadura madurae]MCQ0020830.1 STAS domain-containing protein [Actinomadura madurae]